MKKDSEDTDESDIFGGIKSYRQRMLEKLGPKGEKQSLFLKKKKKEGEEGSDEEDKEVSSSSETSSIRTEITDSDPDSQNTASADLDRKSDSSGIS